MPSDLYAVYNSLSVAKKKEAYDYIMKLKQDELNTPKKIDWEKFSGRNGKCFPKDAQEYVSSLREGDR